MGTDAEQPEEPSLRRVWRVLFWRAGSTEPRSREFATLEGAEREAWRAQSYGDSKQLGPVTVVVVQTRLVSEWANVTRLPALVNVDAGGED